MSYKRSCAILWKLSDRSDPDIIIPSKKNSTYKFGF